MSRLPLHAATFVLCGVRIFAGEREGGAWDNFNAPVMSLRPAKPVLPLATPESTAPKPALRLAAPSPSLTLIPPAPTAAGSGMDSGFFSGAEDGRWRLSRTLERRAESLRQEWANQDARRLEDERANEGVWNRTLHTVLPEPATFRIGNHDIGGGLPTAIRRRNPFALINPAFFSFSF